MRNRLSEILARLARLRVVSRDAPHQRLIIGVATALVFIGAAVSARSLDLSMADLHWGKLGIALALGLLVVPLNAQEYRLSAELAGGNVGKLNAVHTTVLASAMNILPLPASAAIRLQGLREAGASTAQAALATAMTGLMWLATSTGLGSLVLIANGQYKIGLVFCLFTAVAIAGTIAVLRRRHATRSWLVRVFALESCFVALAAVRFYLIVAALGVSLDGRQAIVVATSSSLASATGVIPGSIGLFELLAAGLAKIVELPATSGFLATTILRVMAAITSGLAGLLITQIPLQVQHDSSASKPDGIK